MFLVETGKSLAEDPEKFKAFLQPRCLKKERERHCDHVRPLALP